MLNSGNLSLVGSFVWLFVTEEAHLNHRQKQQTAAKTANNRH